MATWFTSDLHFGHANIIKYSKRPFHDLAHMHETLIDRWNQVVSTDDDVWVLGDLAMGDIEDSLALVRRLHGQKILVSGNHDRCWMFHGAKHQPWIDRYRDAGFDEILQGEVTFQLGDTTVGLCHFPFHGDSQYDDRYTHARPADNGQWLLHGHVHGSWKQWGRMINVGTDVWGYQPVAAEVLSDLVRQGPEDREREQHQRDVRAPGSISA